MKVDFTLPSGILEAAEAAGPLEQAGVNGLWANEAGSDPFADLASASVVTRLATIGTNVAIAFARSPFVVAVSAYEINRASRGRFVLGLGSQVRAHVVHRFGMEWPDAPLARMREYVGALRELFAAFDEDRPPDFRGGTYRHVLAPEQFRPRPSGLEPPAIFLAALGPKQAELAGRVADGLFLHPLCTRPYVEEVIMPAIERGLAHAGRTRERFTVVCPALLAPDGHGDTPSAGEAEVRRRIGFYGSTPAYRPLFEFHGWATVADELNAVIRSGDWSTLASTVPPEVLETVAVAAIPGDLAAETRRRWDAIADRVWIYNPQSAGVAGPGAAAFVRDFQS